LLWICPLFASPMDDNGYDVSDYYKINPRFGTMEDFDRLIERSPCPRDPDLCSISCSITPPMSTLGSKWPSKTFEPKERGYYFFRQRKTGGRQARSAQ
jgi:hypothetical protein